MASDTAIKGSFRSNYFLAYQGLSEARVKWLQGNEKKKNLTSTIRDKVADGRSQRARRRSAGASLLWKLMLMVDCMMRARKYLRWNIDLNENIVRIFLRFLDAI